MSYKLSDNKVVVHSAGKSLDLHKFAVNHPGGQSTINNLHNKNIDIVMRVIHGRDNNVLRMIGANDNGGEQGPISKLDREWFLLQKQCAENSLYEKTVSGAILHYLLPSLLAWFAAWYFMPINLPAAVFCAFIACLKTVHLTHDLGHGAIFKSGRTNRIVNRWAGILLLGMDTRVFSANHMLHHGFTNILGQDEALANGPVKFHPQQGRPLRFQALLWLLCILSSGLYFWLSQFVGLIPKKIIDKLPVAYTYWRKGNKQQQKILMNWKTSLLVLSRMGLFIAVFGVWVTVIPMLLAITVTAYFATLNHFHMPISTALQANKNDEPFGLRQARVTQSWYWKPRGLWSWFSGGLDLHLVHHLLPTLPAFRLAKANKLVRQFCSENKLPYHEVTLPQAMKKAYLKTRNPFNAQYFQSDGPRVLELQGDF